MKLPVKPLSSNSSPCPYIPSALKYVTASAVSRDKGISGKREFRKHRGTERTVKFGLTDNSSVAVVLNGNK